MDRLLGPRGLLRDNEHRGESNSERKLSQRSLLLSTLPSTIRRFEIGLGWYSVLLLSTHELELLSELGNRDFTFAQTKKLINIDLTTCKVFINNISIYPRLLFITDQLRCYDFLSTHAPFPKILASLQLLKHRPWKFKAYHGAPLIIDAWRLGAIQMSLLNIIWLLHLINVIFTPPTAPKTLLSSYHRCQLHHMGHISTALSGQSPRPPLSTTVGPLSSGGYAHARWTENKGASNEQTVLCGHHLRILYQVRDAWGETHLLCLSIAFPSEIPADSIT